MAYQGQQKVQKVMVQPINLIFRYLQGKTRVSVWLFENVNTRMEGVITGFDEYMNLVNINIECDVISGAPLKKGTGGPVIRLYKFEINSTNFFRETNFNTKNSKKSFPFPESKEIFVKLEIKFPLY